MPVAAEITRALTASEPITVQQLNPTSDPVGGNCQDGFASVTGFQGTPQEVLDNVDLSEFDGQTIELRFSFSTGDNLYNAFEGWYIKNILVAGTQSGAPVTAFSDPVSDGDTSFTASSNFGTAPGWHVTDRRNATLDGAAWWYGNEATGTYQSPNPSDNCTDSSANAGTITSVPFTLPATDAKLSFDTLWQIESVNPSSYDLMQVQVIPVSGGQLPGPPQHVTVIPNNGSAYVSWNPPASDGGSPITGYTVTAVPAAGSGVVTSTTSDTSTTVYGLSSDCYTQYTFTVAATNSVGMGPQSAPSDAYRTSGFVSPYAPSTAVILLDGAPSAESGGTYYPIPVSDPFAGVPMVSSYCPTPPGATETKAFFPPGLHDNLWRWDEFPVSGSSSGSSPQSGTACLGAAITTNCLTAPLAGRGVVFLPYSYSGANLSMTASGPTFTLNSYSASDSAGGTPDSQLAFLQAEICSINRAWPSTKLALIGHSYGGLIAEQWWQFYRSRSALTCGLPDAQNGNVTYVFSLDSPVNGILHTTIGGLFGGFSPTIQLLWHKLWSNKGSEDPQQIMPLDGDGSYVPVGTSDDATFAQADFPAAGIQSQLLVTGCFGPFCQLAGDPPNFTSPCPASQTVDGITEHDMVKICPQVITKIQTLVAP